MLITQALNACHLHCCDPVTACAAVFVCAEDKSKLRDVNPNDQSDSLKEAPCGDKEHDMLDHEVGMPTLRK